MEGRLSGRDIAFDAPADSDDEESWQAPQYFLADGQIDPGQLVEAEDFAEDSTSKLQMALGDLDDRSRDILERRWLLDDKSTLHELAAEYQVSAERIRQLEANALKNARSHDCLSETRSTRHDVVTARPVVSPDSPLTSVSAAS